MSEENITIRFKYPWAMISVENSGYWIDAVKRSIKETDPIYGKDIFVSGRHETENLILVDNDSDKTYAIMSYETKGSEGAMVFNTIEIITSRAALAERLHNDYKSKKVA
ncbi:MAG: hypothetical protein K9L82_10615 [Chromatiaceae bacterium]|nr:hypothetical protein [Chromatiaceae bacterium]MCF7993532.1 hypothetical protein [Chromatiaceae bacterium]MCF8005097.1 hypothetical protein [Chromatiaceae bacterium]MCF8014535.1 hypothetical protein [Chromatiaceae bacterium]